MLAPGDRIDGRYRVERLIGEGGMGAVYAVADDAGGRYAMKVLLDTADPTMAKRFHREALMTAKLTSANVTKVFGTGTLADGSPYLLLELLHGEDLGEMVHRQGPLGVHEAVGYVLEVSHALAEAHQLGMVHRDIKPANLFVTTLVDGTRQAKLLDFGISKPALSTVAPMTQLTQSGTVLGSPDYMAPEQLVSSSDVDARADIWAVGATLHELLSGTTAFGGDTLAEVLSAIMRDPPRSLRALRPDVPEALEAVVMRCLEKDPDLRFASIAELVHALNHAVGPPPATLVRPSHPSGPGSGAHHGALAHAPTMAHGSHPAAAGWAALPPAMSPEAPTLVNAPLPTPLVPRVTSIAPESGRRPVWPIAVAALLGAVLAVGATLLVMRPDRSGDDDERQETASNKSTAKSESSSDPLSWMSDGDEKIPKAERKTREAAIERAEKLAAAGDLDEADRIAADALDALVAHLQVGRDRSLLVSRAHIVRGVVAGERAQLLANSLEPATATTTLPDIGRRLTETISAFSMAGTWDPSACVGSRYAETIAETVETIMRRAASWPPQRRRWAMDFCHTMLPAAESGLQSQLMSTFVARKCKKQMIELKRRVSQLQRRVERARANHADGF